jgi:hypothetical protein
LAAASRAIARHVTAAMPHLLAPRRCGERIKPDRMAYRKGVTRCTITRWSPTWWLARETGPTRARCPDKLRSDPAVAALTCAGTAPREMPGRALAQ